MRYLATIALLLVACVAPDRATRPNLAESSAIQATKAAWVMHNQPDPWACGEPLVLRDATDAEMLTYCNDSAGFACYQHFPPMIVLSSRIPPDMIWASGEPVIHETIHFLGHCTRGQPDHDHSNPNLWRSAGDNSVQETAQQEWYDGYWN